MATRMTNGLYKTEKGSIVQISCTHSGIYEIAFDWVEEDAYFDCDPSVYDGRLIWSCDQCGGGSADLKRVT